MKNNTKVRLHLSKTLFENIVKEVLSEAKKMNMSGGAYTESVKMPKKAKKMEEVNAVTDSERMRKMHEMSSKEKMAKGLYKEVDAFEILKQYKTGMKLQKKGKPDETFTIQMVQPGGVKGMEAAHALHLKNDKTGQEFTDSPGNYEVVESMREDEMGSSDKYPVGTVLFKPKGNQTITVKRVEGDKIFVVSDLTPNREFQWSADVIDDGIRTKEFQLKSADQNEMQVNVAEAIQFSIPDILSGKHSKSNSPLNTIEDYKPGMKVVANKFYGNKEELNQSYGTVTGVEGGKVQYKRADGKAENDPADLVIVTGQATESQAMGEMQINVAEEGQMNEMTDAVSWEAIAAGMTAIGLAPLAINKLHQWWEKKHPESFKKAQKLSGAIDKQMGGNTPGQGHGVDTKKTFGPQNENKKKVMPKLNELRKQIKNK